MNGQTQPTLSLATRAYRFRLLNGSSSRVYKLAWATARRDVIGSDGGLLEQLMTATVSDPRSPENAQTSCST